MGCAYFPFFDVSQLALGTMTLDGTGALDAIPLTLNAVTWVDGNSDQSSLFNQHLFSGVTGNDIAGTARHKHLAAASYSAALTQLFQTAIEASDWGPTDRDFNILLSTTTWRFTISANVAFSVAWSNALGRSMFGFAADSSSATSHTGTLTPHYMVQCTLDAPSPGMSTIYEPDGLGSHVVADSGEGSTMARYESPIYSDWVQQYETKIRTFRNDAGHELDLSHPYSFQQLYEDGRRYGLPFKLGGTEVVNRIYSLRTDGMSFQPSRASDGNDAQFHVPFKCLDEGRG